MEIKIKRLKLKSFLSIGNDPLEIKFTKYKNILSIVGENRDVGENASNGSGKSTIFEGLVYALSGKFIKDIDNQDAINVFTKKGMQVELDFDIGKDEYQVIRKREPNRVMLYKNGHDISLSGMPATNNYIQSLIKLTHKSIKNIMCFGQHNLKTFLSCDKAEKRQIAENLLSLDNYSVYSDRAKELLKTGKKEIQAANEVYSDCLRRCSSSRNKKNMLLAQQQTWRTRKKQELDSLVSEISTLETKIKKLYAESEFDAATANQELEANSKELKEAKKKLTELNELYPRIENALNVKRNLQMESSTTLSRTERELAESLNKIQEITVRIESVGSQSGQNCMVCFGEIGSSNVESIKKYYQDTVENLSSKVKSLNESVISQKQKVKEIDSGVKELLESRQKLSNATLNYSAKIQSLSSRQSELMSLFNSNSSEIPVLNKMMDQLKTRQTNLMSEIEGDDPYIELIRFSDIEIDENEKKSDVVRKKIESIEEKMPYYEFWVSGFGDTGIRSLAIARSAPALNNRINFCLQPLIDNKIRLEFDHELNEKITKYPDDGTPFVYPSLSGGEVSRIDLAITMGFSHATTYNAGVSLSLVILDEVGSNFDRPGMIGLFKLIQEMSRHKQVIIVTHDPDLLDMLAPYDKIKVVKENNFTRLVES